MSYLRCPYSTNLRVRSIKLFVTRSVCLDEKTLFECVLIDLSCFYASKRAKLQKLVSGARNRQEIVQNGRFCESETVATVYSIIG